MGFFEVVPIPRNVTVIPTRFVYTHKADDLKGAVYKARCVVQGFRQKEGIHFNRYRVSSPVVELSSIRTLTAIATENDFPIHHLDIKSAYLNAPLPKGEEIYVKPPKGHEIMGKCWLLKKSVYGMKQAGYEWNKYLAMRLDALGFSENDLDESVFKRESKFGKLIVALYVDDLFLVAENDEVLSEFKEELEGMFDLKYFGPVSEYLGIEFKRTKEGYVMSQHKYLKELLENFKEHNIRKHRYPVKVDYEGYGSNNNPKEDVFYETPVDTSPKLKASMKTKYESGVGSINWAANNTRPDLAFAAHTLASKASNPTENDFQRLLFCLGYIEESMAQVLEYSRLRSQAPRGEFIVETFSDASYAPGDDVKSVSGMVIYVNRNPVKWLSKKQNNVTRSTAAAELVALSVAEDRTVHSAELMRGLGFKVAEMKLYEDNQAVIACCENKSLSHTRKLVDVRMKLIRQRLTQKYYTIEYVNSAMNIADMFTKALPAAMFRSLTERLLMQEPVRGETGKARISSILTHRRKR
ncbi:hypothetical protein JCM33374_g445 [Metschnikowia sp. JCM 33374]|nr:hypothetical protein JCM33374_g445 [Metschnikowia sp. JCM 33374]